MKGASFDGKNMGYVPPKKLSISKKLKLHTKRAKNIDPITYEVVRHSLWHVNEEHGATIQRLSGSPVAMYALDLNPSILAEDGVMPPMSYWCRQLVTQQKSSPFQNTGQMSITSCWCAAPTQGSLARNMSPSRMPGLSPRNSRIHFTCVSVTPDMYCMYGPK